MKTKRRNLTLLELVVCLGILAALAAVTLDYCIDAKERQCAETTVERGEAVRDAMTGRSSGNGVSRFLSDMGRWPRVHVPTEGDGDGGRRLAELFDASVWYHGTGESALSHEETVSGRTIQRILREADGTTFPGEGGLPLAYPEVSMAVGWRGPYLNMGSSGRSFYDGWGHPWQIVTNYNLKRAEGGCVEENTAGMNRIQIKDALDADDDGIRIDGILSYGANHASDPGDALADASDRDLQFLFPHDMDNFAGCSQASLTVELRIPESGSDGRIRWKRPKNIEPWKPEGVYYIGDVVSYGDEGNEAIWCCHTAHVAGIAWDASKWLNWSEAGKVQNYTVDPHTAPVGSFLEYRHQCYCRTQSNTATPSNPDDDSDWTRLFQWEDLADQVSLIIFCPVMTATENGKSAMHTGYYHFFRTAQAANGIGVKPYYRADENAAAVVDVNCDRLPADANYASDDYNGRYLTAEDRHAGNGAPRWNEFSIRRLVPGKRKVFCAFYNSKTGVYMSSEVEEIDLKPGDNQIVLYLERRW